MTQSTRETITEQLVRLCLPKGMKPKQFRQVLDETDDNALFKLWQAEIGNLAENAGV